MVLYDKSQEIENSVLSASSKHISGTFEEHSHNFFEIEYIIDGCGEYYINGKPHSIRKGMLFFMSPSDFHSVKNCDANIINVMFSCSLCDAKPLYCLFAPHRPSAISLWGEESFFIQKIMFEIAESKEIEYSIVFLQSLLFKLAKFLEKENFSAEKDSPNHIRSAIIYILENFRQNPTLKDAANFTKLAPAYLSHIFSTETGTNFKTYLDNIKFGYASKLLLFTELSVAEICTSSGFSDYTNFSRRFKKNFGCTPSDYRKNFSESYL